MKNGMKWLLVLMLAVLCVSFTACGKKDKEEDDGYEYTAVFDKLTIKPVKSNGYISSQYIDNGKLYGLEAAYDEQDYTKQTLIVHALDLASGDDATVELKVPAKEGNTENQSYSSAFRATADGKYYVIFSQWNEEGSHYSCSTFGSDGSFEKEFSLDPVVGDAGYLNTEAMAVTPEGNLVMVLDSSVACVNAEGKKVAEVSAGSYIRALQKASNGDIYCTYYSENGMQMARLDIKNGEFTDQKDLPLQANYVFAGDKKILISSNNSVKEVDVASGETKSLWGWLDVDINADNILSIQANEDGTYGAITSTYGENGQVIESAKISYVKKSENSRETLVLGCLDLDWKVRDAIREYNRSSDKYRITVKCYSEDFTDYTEANDKFRMDLTSGNKFDIISVYSGDYSRYVNASALADLTEYFDRDLNRDDYFWTVFETLSKKGKLYGITPSFQLNSMMVSKETAAGRTSWTLNDVMELRKKNPDKAFLEGADKMTAMYMLLYYSLDDFIDTDKSECHFDSDSFKQILEFAKSFPDTIDYENFNTWQAISDGDILIGTLSIYDVEFSDLKLYNTLFGGEGVLIGFPTDGDKGNRISAGNILSITSKSKKKDAAWEFMKTFLGEDFQRDQWNMPVLKKVFDEKAAESIKNDGESHMGIGNGFTTISIDPPTQKDVDLVKAAIENATGTGEYDEQIFTILQEETEPFFKGQKTADEVSAVIQSRINLYLKEQG